MLPQIKQLVLIGNEWLFSDYNSGLFSHWHMNTTRLVDILTIHYARTYKSNNPKICVLHNNSISIRH